MTNCSLSQVETRLCPIGHMTSESGSGDVTQTSSGSGRRGRRPAKIIGDENASDEAVIRLAAETLTVGKRVVETGRVRVRRTTTERTQKVSIPLSKETYDVRRVPVGKLIKKTPKVRQTADEIIIPVVEEVVVVERRLVLKEELHIRKVRSADKHVEQVTLRVQKATIDRVAPQSSDDGPTTAARAEGSSRRRRPANQQRK